MLKMMLADISISLGGNFLFFLVLFIIVTVLAILFYRYTLPPLSVRRRIILSVLRGIALIGLLLIFFEPILRLLRSDTQQPVVAVLVDNSQSMTLPLHRDKSVSRAEWRQQLLKENHVVNLSSGTKTELMVFSSKLQQLSETPIDSLQSAGEITNISGALDDLKKDLSRKNIQAVILITDGNYTAGRNPLYDAEALGIPIYTVGVGDTSEQRDILIGKVVTNNLAYAGTRVPVDVTVKSSGYSGDNVEVMLIAGSTIHDKKVLTVHEGTLEYRTKLFIVPREEGMQKYTVKVSSLPGELTEKNNTNSFFINVLKSRLRILLITGAPSADVAAIRQVFSEDEHFSIQTLVQKDQREFYEGSFSRQIVDSADCLIFIGFPSSATENYVLMQIRDIVLQAKKPLLFVNSKSTDYAKLQLLDSYLPFRWSSVSSSEVFVFPSIIERYKLHALVNLEGKITADNWHQLPPIYKSQTVFLAKPESDILASVKLQNVVLNEPLIVARSINRQKSLAITGHGIWRWRMLSQGNPEIQDFFSLFLTNAAHWLTTREDGKNVRVLTVKEMFTTAEAVEFIGQVYDEQLRPIDGAELTVELIGGQEKSQLVLNAIGNGMYEGSVQGLSEGDYSFVAKASRDGKLYGEDKGKFSVGQMNVEFLETKMNKQLLEQLAYRTGGRYYDVSSVEELARDLNKDVKFVQKEITKTSEIELWNWHYLAAALVVLFSLEWFMRKRSGML
ncbi:MAG: VWA domain-containing protein [Ignavibacteriae bacterium]|nr:VWA domain-containing protein [Ignavibacteriota bacterium]